MAAVRGKLSFAVLTHGCPSQRPAEDHITGRPRVRELAFRHRGKLTLTKIGERELSQADIELIAVQQGSDNLLNGWYEPKTSRFLRSDQSPQAPGAAGKCRL